MNKGKVTATVIKEFRFITPIGNGSIQLKLNKGDKHYAYKENGKIKIKSNKLGRTVVVPTKYHNNFKIEI